ncbi:MAG: hypothetical protein LJE92_11135 [Gammaproteobacteria bacterium]|nr:hypothetical protein [Gammaproteobacteria bacterium]
MKNRDLRRMFEAMQGMHKLSRTLMAGMGGLLSECQRAASRIADLVDTGSFILRIIDDQGGLMFEVLTLDTDKQVANSHYDLPPGMKIIDIDEKMR